MNEKSFFFNEPVEVRKIQFIVHDAVGPGGLYYWKMGMIGCKKSEGKSQKKLWGDILILHHCF